MVEAEPALLHLFRQRGQSLIESRPVAKFLETGRAPLAKSLVQMEESLVIHVMIEVNVGTHHRVIQEKPSYLADCKPLVIQKYSSGGQGGFQKDSDGIH